MAVLNIHERRLAVPPERAGALLDSLAGADDRLWPAGDWPPLRLDRGLEVGSSGGHGPIRYTVLGYAPGEWVRFRFDGRPGFHDFSVAPADGGGAVLRHTLVLRPVGRDRLAWPLMIRWLHDALVEDALDRAERETTGAVARPARWSVYVRLLRSVVKRRRS